MTDTRTAAIDFRSFEPYYVQLTRILLKDLETNRAEGHLLPSEAELCAQYSVSRTVVRQALADLEREGLVLKIKGKGTFVTGRKMDTSFIQDTLGFYESTVKAGHVVESRILKLKSEPCSVDTARVLEIGVGEPVVQFDRVRSVDGRPVPLPGAAGRLRRPPVQRAPGHRGGGAVETGRRPARRAQGHARAAHVQHHPLD